MDYHTTHGPAAAMSPLHHAPISAPPPKCLTFRAPGLVLILCNPNYISGRAHVRNCSLASESHHAWKTPAWQPTSRSLASLSLASPRAGEASRRKAQVAEVASLWSQAWEAPPQAAERGSRGGAAGLRFSFSEQQPRQHLDFCRYFLLRSGFLLNSWNLFVSSQGERKKPKHQKCSNPS